MTRPAPLRPPLRGLAVCLLALAAPAAFAQKTPPKPAVQTEAPAALGAWDYLIGMPDREPRGLLTVERATSGYKGSITTDSERRFDTIELRGDALRATFQQPGFGDVAINATVGADGTLSGTVTANGGSFPLTATRAVAVPPARTLAPADLVGRWRYELDLPDGGRPFGTFVFEQSGSRLKGRAIGFAESPFDTLDLDGARFVATFTPRGFSPVTVDATVAGDTMTGTFSGIDPETDAPVSLPLTATRTDG